MNHSYSSLLQRGAQRGLLLLGLAGLLPVAQAQVSFSAPATYTTRGFDQGIVTADFNGDGRPDLATASSGNNAVSVLLQSSTIAGTFSASTNYGSGGSFNPVLAVGDLNGDGRPDLATINQSSNTVGVLLNSATTPGTFAAAVTYGTAGNDGRGIAIADMNGDGRLDLVIANGTTVGILLNSATTPGTFGTAATYSGGGATLDELLVGDLNGDGRPDVVVGSRTATTVSVLLNSATTPGTLGTASPYTVGNSGYLRGVALGDLNNDGRLDIAVSNYNDRTISVLLNSATAPGTFLPTTNYATGSTQGPVGVTIGDLDGDGRADIVASNYNMNSGTTISILVNSATTPGTFSGTPTVLTTGGSGPIHAVIRDLNADSRPDLAVSNFISNNVGVLLNTTVFAAPTLTSLSPTSGPVGTSVTIMGTNLSSATGVSFNGTAATTFTIVSATTITTTVPTGATSGNVTVTTGGGTSNGVAFAVAVAPTVTTAAASSIMATSAVLGGAVTADGNATVTDRGVVYSSTNATPTIGGAGVIKDANGSGSGTYSKAISGLTPATTYYVRAYATNLVGTSYGSVASFTTLVPTTVAPVLTAPANNSTTANSRPTYAGTAPAGSTVTVFVNGTSVGTTTATGGSFSLVQPTALPDGSYSVYATAQASGQLVSAASNTNTFTVAAAPTLTAFSPATGPVGTSVTITGTNLTGATAVRFNGTAASSFVVNSATSITAVVAAGTTTGLVSVTTPNGTATSATPFVVRVAPTTVADAYTTPQNVTLTGNVLANDLGTNPVAILINHPANGTLVLNPNGSFTYRPNAGYTGPDSFTYYACDPAMPLLCGNPATVSITVTRVAPITVADAYTTPAGVTLTGNVLTNDIGTNPRAILITRTTNGTLVLNPDGTFSYRPNAGFTGLDSFTYYACDPAMPLLCGNPATVSITVTRVAPITVADAYSTPAGVTLTGNVLSNDLGTNPRAILINRPANGTLVLNPDGSFRYTPNAGFSGADSFTYYACDPAMPLLCGNPATVSITVLRIAPVTVADAYTTPQNTTLTGNVLANDLGTNPRAILINRPLRGTLVLNPDGSFSYRPNAGFTGLDSFTYYACDPNMPLLCGNPATVSITVTPATNTRTAAQPAATAAKPAALTGAVLGSELALTGSPNPFSEQLRLSFALPTAQAYTLAVYDAQGRLVQQLASGQAEAGQAQQLEVPTQAYATGLYFVRLTTAAGTQLLKLIKQ